MVVEFDLNTLAAQKGSFFYKMIFNRKKFLATIFLIALAILILPVSYSFAQVIQTGDSQATSVVENNVNTVIKTCCSPTPTQGPTPTPVQENTPTPTTELTPTPTSGSSDNNNGGSSGSGGGDGRSDGLSSCPECTRAPMTKQVLGLSTTSGNGNVFISWVQLLSAFGLISTGALFFKKNA